MSIPIILPIFNISFFNLYSLYYLTCKKTIFYKFKFSDKKFFLQQTSLFQTNEDRYKKEFSWILKENSLTFYYFINLEKLHLTFPFDVGQSLYSPMFEKTPHLIQSLQNIHVSTNLSQFDKHKYGFLNLIK